MIDMSDKEQILKEYKRMQRKRRVGIIIWTLILILVITGIASIGILMKSGRSLKHLLPSGWSSKTEEAGYDEEIVHPEKAADTADFGPAAEMKEDDEPGKQEFEQIDVRVPLFHFLASAPCPRRSARGILR